MNKEEQVMEQYQHWLNRENGYTRASMTRSAYNKMMKQFSEYGLKRNNFGVSVKQYQDRASYEKARCSWMRDWRLQRWEKTEKQ